VRQPTDDFADLVEGHLAAFAPKLDVARLVGGEQVGDEGVADEGRVARASLDDRLVVPEKEIAGELQGDVLAGLVRAGDEDELARSPVDVEIAADLHPGHHINCAQ
jgi:hypothetical protein